MGPLYCGHIWDHTKCPVYYAMGRHFRGSLYTSPCNWDLKSVLIKGGVLISEVSLERGSTVISFKCNFLSCAIVVNHIAKELAKSRVNKPDEPEIKKGWGGR